MLSHIQLKNNTLLDTTPGGILSFHIFHFLSLLFFLILIPINIIAPKY